MIVKSATFNVTNVQNNMVFESKLFLHLNHSVYSLYISGAVRLDSACVNRYLVM